MNNNANDLNELHWLMDMIQSIDAGLIVLDRNYQVEVWNTFMENHSSLSADVVRSKVIFDLFPDLEMNWFKNKVDTVFKLKNRAFSNWEQRPYLFKFNHYRPITGTERYMYQNLTLIPLSSADGAVNHICIIVYDVTDIASQRKEMSKMYQQLEELSRIDTMTSLYNRRYWDECLSMEYQRYQRTNAPRTLIMYDIDNLEEINRKYSYRIGDQVIQSVVKQLQTTQRDTDFSCRFAGKQFAIILSNVTESSARIFAERLRSKVEKKLLEFDDTEIKVTISLGVAELTVEYKDTATWIESVKYALQHAKNNGRNKTVLYSKL